MQSRTDDNTLNPNFSSLLNDIIHFSNNKNAKNIILFLNIILQNQTTLENCISAINTKKVTGGNADLAKKMRDLASIYFEDRNESHREIIKDKVDFITLTLDQHEKESISPPHPLDILKKKIENYLDDIEPTHEKKCTSEIIINQTIAECTTILSEIDQVQAQTIEKDSAIASWITKSYVRTWNLISILYLRLAEPHREKNYKTNDNVLRQLQIKEKIIFLNCHIKSYDAEKQLLTHWMNNPELQISSNFNFYPRSYFVKNMESFSKIIKTCYSDLEKLEHNHSYKEKLSKFHNNHELFMKELNEKIQDTTKLHVDISDDYQILTGRFKLKEAREAYSRMYVEMLKDSIIEQSKYFLPLVGYAQIALALDLSHPQLNHFKKIPLANIRTLKEFYQDLLQALSPIKNDSPLKNELLNLPHINCIISNLVSIIGIEDSYFYTNVQNCKVTKDSRYKSSLINKLYFLNILSDFIQLCLHCGKSTFAVENSHRIKQFYAAHAMPLTDDLTILFDLLQKEIVITNKMLGRKETIQPNISEAEIAKAETAYTQLIDECNAEIEQATKHYEKLMRSKLTEDEDEDKEQSQNSTVNSIEIPDASITKTSETIYPKEAELYFEASKLEITAPKTLKGSTQLLLAIKKYTEAKEVAKASGNHRFVVGSIQEIANCYLQIAIRQPYYNLSSALMMYKDASKNANEALAYLNQHSDNLTEYDSTPTLEDLFKGIHLIMSSITDAVAQTENILKKQESLLSNNLTQEKELLLKIIEKIGAKNWYQNKSWDKRSQYSHQRAANIQTLAQNRAHLTTLTKVIHGEGAIIDTSVSYRTLFSDQSQHPLEYLQNADEKMRMREFSKITLDETFTTKNIGEKLKIINQIETKLTYLTVEQPKLLNNIGFFQTLTPTESNSTNSFFLKRIAL